MTMTMDLISLIVTRNEWVIPKTVPRSVWAIDCSLYQWRAVFNWSPLCDQVSQSTIPRCQGGVFDVPSQPRSWFISIAAQNAVFSVIKLQKRRRKKIMKFVHKELKTLFLNSVDIFIPFQPCSIPDQRPPVPIVDWSKVNNRSVGNLTTLQAWLQQQPQPIRPVESWLRCPRYHSYWTLSMVMFGHKSYNVGWFMPGISWTISTPKKKAESRWYPYQAIADWLAIVSLTFMSLLFIWNKIEMRYTLPSICFTSMPLALFSLAQ